MLANATRASEPLVNLFDEGTPADLACRGFGQAEILSRTGFDAGYHTNGLRGVTKGIDRLVYKRQHVLERVTPNVVEEALAAYAAGDSDAEGVLSALGLANPSVCKLRDLFSGTPFEAAFKQSDKAHRHVRMTSGFAARHDGVDNPFKLDEYREMAADTREKRYGGRYTLSSGSAKADAARATFADHMADDEFRADVQQRKSETCRENYGVDHPAQSSEVQTKIAVSRAASGNKTLYKEGSTRDLFFRGWSVQEARQMSGDGCKKSARQLGASHRLAYGVAHIRARVGIERFSEAMAAYGRDECNIDGIFDRIGLKRTNSVSISRLADAFGLGDSWKTACAALQAIRSESTADMWEERYGVRNISQLESIKQKKRDTTMAHYGATSYIASDEGKAHMHSVVRERYGVDNVSQIDDVKRKKIATSLEHYGVEHTMQAPEVRARMAESLRQRYDVDDENVLYPFQIEAVRQKAADTCETNFGVRNPFESAEVQAEIRDGWLHEYGVENPSQVPEIQQRRIRTIQRRYGVDNPFQNDAIKEKSRRSMLERYGVLSPWHIDGIAEIMRAHTIETNRERYGADYWAQVAENARIANEHRIETVRARYGSDYWTQIPENAKVAHDRLVETMLERYGVQHWSQVPEMRQAAHAKAVVTIRARYGVDHWMQDPENARMAHAKVLENGSVVPSFGELVIFDTLCSIYGEDDVECQYLSDDRYPFACDFYVRSRDLFIELNGTWTHGGHWYRSTVVEDMARAELWRTKNSAYYRGALENWTSRDVRKREAARDADLNYVVFWDGSKSMMDARLWFAMGCPDGHDWEYEYSWLPERQLSLVMDTPKLTGTSRNVTSIARWANGNVFYARELALWEKNSYEKRWGTLRASLYMNRYKYMRSGDGGSGLYAGKLPDELTDFEIVRGLGIMGKVRAYSTFDNSAMVDVIKRYGVTSVLDPCAGWGERLATCCWLGLAYLGIDVNERLFAGYERIVGEYGDMLRQRCVCADAAEARVDGAFDAVITCPPYGSLEHYSDAGAENLSEDEFSAWWERVVANVTPHVSCLFCVQTNQACKDVFADGLEANGWCFVESVELAKRSSHMTRKRGGVDLKREFEEMLVFERVHEPNTPEVVVG